MPITQDEVSREIKLDIPSEVPEEVAKDIKKEIGEFIVESILNDVADSKSPVKNGKFKAALSKEYAEKTGKKNANLDLEGDMLNALVYHVTKEGVEVGIFDKKETPKAYNHNVGDTLPQRRFIPSTNQRFTDEIEKGIKEIIQDRSSEFKREIIREEPRRQFVPDELLPEKVVSSKSAFDSLISSLFGDNNG